MTEANITEAPELLLPPDYYDDPSRFEINPALQRAVVHTILPGMRWVLGSTDLYMPESVRSGIEGPVVCTAPHRGFEDVPRIVDVMLGLGFGVPRFPFKAQFSDMRFVGSKVGRAFELTGGVAVDRDNPNTKLLTVLGNELDRGVSTAIFPGSTRIKKNTRDLEPFKNGAVVLATRRNSLLLPLSFAGSSKEDKRFGLSGRKKVVGVIAEPLEPSRGAGGIKATQAELVKRQKAALDEAYERWDAA